MRQELFVGGLLAFALTSLLLWVLEPVAQHIGLVDNPGGRKNHRYPTPLVGGIAMFIAFAFAVLIVDVPLSEYRLLFAGSLLLVVVGTLDDLLGSLRAKIPCRWVKFSCGKFRLGKELLAGAVEMLDGGREWAIGRFRAAVEQLG